MISSETRSGHPAVSIGLVGVLLVAIQACAGRDDGWRTLEIDTREVTTPDVTASPDGSTIVFSLLGHLFLLPEGGGQSIQLTEGPYFDARPAFSPDGSQLAFQSDRDGSDGNVFLLDIESGHISQLTFEPWADAPAWSPNGNFLVYLKLSSSPSGVPEATVRRVRLRDGGTETLLAVAGDVRSPFVLGDGRPGWLAVGWEKSPIRAFTEIQVLESDGSVSSLRRVDGIVDALVPGENGFYARRFTPRFRLSHVSDDRSVVWIPRDDAPSGSLASVDLMGIQGHRGEPRFGWTAATQALYVGDRGKLWRVSATGQRDMEEVPFHASVRMEVRRPVPPPRWVPPTAMPSSGALVITNVRVLDLDAGAFTAETSLLIENGRISRIGDRGGAVTSDGADILDAHGGYAIPGLFDMHGHMDWCWDPSYVQRGITSMRNLGAAWEELRQPQTLPPGLGANCFFGGELISGWDFGGHVKPTDSAEAKALVRRMAEGGASHIKLHYTLPWTLAAAAAEEARALGLPVVRHADTAEDIVRTVVLGGNPTHMTGRYEDLLQLLALSQSRVDLTLQTSGSTMARLAHDAGVTVLLGTDLRPEPMGSDLPGPEAFYRGMESLSDAGISTLAILKMVTLTAAETVGAERDLGSLAEGKVADIILLDRNPLDDIKNMRQIRSILRAGSVVPMPPPGPPFKQAIPADATNVTTSYHRRSSQASWTERNSRDAGLTCVAPAGGRCHDEPPPVNAADGGRERMNRRR